MKAHKSVERWSVERKDRRGTWELLPDAPTLQRSNALRIRAFTLVEVMIALGIFFAAVFTILALVSQILRNARGLQRPQVDSGLAAAIYVNTNRFPEGTMSGELGDSLADFSYEIDTEEFATNGLMQADIVLSRRAGRQAPDTLSILVFDPNYQSTPFGARPR
jgi:hypothetical protein